MLTAELQMIDDDWEGDDEDGGSMIRMIFDFFFVFFDESGWKYPWCYIHLFYISLESD